MQKFILFQTEKEKHLDQNYNYYAMYILSCLISRQQKTRSLKYILNGNNADIDMDNRYILLVYQNSPPIARYYSKGVNAQHRRLINLMQHPLELASLLYWSYCSVQYSLLGLIIYKVSSDN